MPWADLALVVILAAFTVNGLMQGLVRQVASLAGFVIGFVLALFFYRQFAQTLLRYMPPTIAPEPLVFAAILLSVWITVNLVGFGVKDRAHGDGVAWLDDAGGAVLGLVSGVLILAILSVSAVRLNLPIGQTLLDESTLAAWLITAVGRAANLLSDWWPLPAWFQ